MLAWYFQRNEAVLRARHFLVGGVLLLVPFLLILRQPDLGTALMIGASASICCSLPVCRGKSFSAAPRWGGQPAGGVGADA